MSRSGYVTAVAVWTGDRLKLLDEFAFSVGVKSLKPGAGEEFEVRIERLVAARTTEQNRAYWGFVVRPVALYSHMSQNDVHRFFKAELLPSERFVLSDPDTGEVKLERSLERNTTATLSEQDFRDYTENCRGLAMEQVGIDMSDRGLWEQFGIGRG